tara:strand:+ start:1039 stop:1422 length:384 start_codon:yes stop_codon:yes gene_type:complete
MRKYFYFRDVADEDNDDDVSSSITIPVSDITGVTPTAITTLDVYYKTGDATVPSATGGTGAGTGKVELTCTRGKLIEVMAEIASHANSTKPANSGLIIMGDVATTGFGGEAQSSFFFSNNVTANTIT